jgi:hypothetical protein
MRCGGKMTNKYNIGQTLYRPLFSADGCFEHVIIVRVEQITQIFRERTLGVRTPTRIDYMVNQEIYPTHEQVGESELFSTQKEAEEYAYYHGLAQIRNIDNSLQELEIKYPSVKEKFAK